MTDIIAQQFQFQMQTLKEKAQISLTKLQQQIEKAQACCSDNPESSTATELRTIEQHTEIYCKDKLTLEQKIKQSETKITTTTFKAILSKALGQIKDEQNEFGSIDHNPFHKPPNKNMKTKTKQRRIEPTVESHPQYFRVDQQISHRLFMHYRALPVGMPKSGALSFQEKQHHRMSMNYLKIVQILKDADLALEINQKLMILRSIKKFAFNQNFINEEEFNKIFKVIVHGLGYQQKVFDDLLSKKSIAKYLSPQTNKQLSSSRAGSRVYRFKTDANAHKIIDVSQRQENPRSSQQNPLKTGQQSCKTNLSSPFNRRQTAEASSRKHETNHGKSRIKHGRQLRSGSTGSYLIKAIQAQKLSKITWDSLFSMNEDSMHYHIVIPEIVRGAISEKLDYI